MHQESPSLVEYDSQVHNLQRFIGVSALSRKPSSNSDQLAKQRCNDIYYEQKTSNGFEGMLKNSLPSFKKQNEYNIPVTSEARELQTKRI